MSFSSQEMAHLQGIIGNFRSTNFGRRWPVEYEDLFRVWGYFNRVYDLLYQDPQEWVRIAKFALDSRFQHLSQVLANNNSVRYLAGIPCIGDGRSNYEPQIHIRIAFSTLRETFNVSLDQVCAGQICVGRQDQGWQICRAYAWPNRPSTIVEPRDAIYTLPGATLAIAYQIRNNLFHGAKIQARERDIELVRLATDIVQVVLEQVAQSIGM